MVTWMKAKYAEDGEIRNSDVKTHFEQIRGRKGTYHAWINLSLALRNYHGLVLSKPDLMWIHATWEYVPKIPDDISSEADILDELDDMFGEEIEEDDEKQAEMD